MADSLSIGVIGDKEFSTALERGVRYAEAPIRPVAPGIQQIVVLAVRGQYRSKGTRGPTGRQWTRKPETVRRYSEANRKGFKYINEEMRRTDALFVSEVTIGGPHGILEVGDDYLIMGTDLAYGKIWQDKGQKQYDLTAEDVRDVKNLMVRGLSRSFTPGLFDYKDSGEIPF